MKFSNDTAKLLTETAFGIAMQLLKDTGNQPHENQRKALHAILDAMTCMAQGSLKGRWAFGLQTGLGKTTCAMSWATALSRLGLAGDVSAVIAAQDVESLCETFDALRDLGVDKDQVGLLHRKSSARYPATLNATDKPILLLCHARVKDRFLDQFKYRGEMRDLLIYDESLVTTASCTCGAQTLYEIAGAVESRCQRNADDREELGELSTWLAEVSDAIASELNRLKDLGVTQSVMRLPHRSQETLDTFTELTSQALKKNETILNLIQLCPSPVKVANFNNKGVVSYQVTVPSELKNIIILDASHPIRDLVRDDTSVLDAEEHLPKVKAVGVPLASLKRYDGTTVYQMKAGGGKSSVLKSFKQIHSHQRRICKEVIEVLTRIPKDESTLIIAFKPVYEQTGPVSFVNILEADINASKVVTMKNQDSVEMAGDKPRVSITTWGLHKGTNKYKHCKSLIMVGIIHRDPFDLLGVVVGHKGDLSRECTWQRLKDLQLSEVAHDAFQAIGRIQCRTVVNGVALPVNVWLIHSNNRLREKLQPVMHGAVWKKWETKYDEIPEGREKGIIATAAQAVSDYLDKLVAIRKTRTSSKAIRKAVSECAKLQPDTFTAVIAKALELNGRWLREGRSLVFVEEVFPKIAV
ncbi:MAG: hypothetical protein A4E19_17975 [Nitrospira sp. SG-bin1]|nr:MAG: hypothetical protein A4E19_17975 [Nitrospira sp. SG-bin1]